MSACSTTAASAAGGTLSVALGSTGSGRGCCGGECELRAMVLGGVAAGTGALMMAGVAVPLLGPALMGGALMSYWQREQNWSTDQKYYLNEALEQKTVYVGETVRGSIFMPAVEFTSITIAYSSADGSRRDRVQLGASTQDLGENAFTPALSRSTVREAQRLLNELGYEAGTPDGIVGNKTIAATKAFQENHGLVADGIIGRATLEKLEAESQQ